MATLWVSSTTGNHDLQSISTDPTSRSCRSAVPRLWMTFSALWIFQVPSPSGRASKGSRERDAGLQHGMASVYILVCSAYVVTDSICVLQTHSDSFFVIAQPSYEVCRH